MVIITFELNQSINYPIARTFEFLSHLTNMPRWNYFIQRVSQISEGAVAKGTVFEQKRPSDLFFVQVVEFVPPHQVMFRVQPPGPDLLLAFNLSGDEQQTHVQYSWTLDLRKYSVLRYIPGGAFKNWILTIIKKQILTKTKPAVEQNFYKLKTLLENGEVLLQDGRSTKVS